ncbi:MAG: BMP family ABC transporter substrate-binding protein [Chloroflexi bacterium]|nr:BMP family ABC transporter substrate-binding protein [Chloroflexota bacterium]
MTRKRLFSAVNLLAIIAMLLTACATPAAAPSAAPAAGTVPVTTTVAAGDTPVATTAAASADAGSFQIPEVEEGKFNVAMVLLGPHDDGGWSQAHYEGLLDIEKKVEGVHTAYIELVPEGASSEQVFRSLARKGFNLIFATSFGYMDPMATVAEEFPDTTFIHIAGFKSNETNFGNVFGAMEVMKYLAGMLAGSRAKTDNNPRIGYMATFPIPEELRLGNAFALGMRKTCPNCTMDVRWINTWHDPVIEKEAAASLFDAGVDVVFTGADTPAAGDVAQEKGKWGINYDWSGNCTVERCLTTEYWNWGPVYSGIAQEVKDGKYKPGSAYFDADSGALGLYGFMEGQTPQPGVKDLPAEDVKLVKDTLAAALAGKFTRFDVFKGPIKDNKGNEILADGVSLEQADLDGFKEFGSPCKTCMYWWAEGVTAELPKLQ